MSNLLKDDKKLINEWDYEKNRDIDVIRITLGSNKKVWWKCKNGHEWEASIYSRSKKGCPYCSGQRLLKGYNDLETVNPKLASEWNYEKNNELKPDIIKYSN